MLEKETEDTNIDVGVNPVAVREDEEGNIPCELLLETEFEEAEAIFELARVDVVEAAVFEAAAAEAAAAISEAWATFASHAFAEMQPRTTDIQPSSGASGNPA